MRQIATKGLEGRVAIDGRRPRAEVAELLGRAHVLVSPSVPTAEGQARRIPVVLMEAMASGVPVVASGISGIPELVEDGRTGLLVLPVTRRRSRLAARTMTRPSANRSQAPRETWSSESSTCARTQASSFAASGCTPGCRREAAPLWSATGLPA